MGLQTQTASNDVCNDKIEIKEFVSDLQQKLIENIEYIKNLSEDPTESIPNDNEKLKMEQLIAENTELGKRCNDLEQSLELLRNEYDRCEDYWANKLDEERKYFDQDKQQSDAEFKELLTKMNELGESIQIEDSNKLPVIEEDSNENQFMELQDEFEEYKLMAEKQIQNQQTEIDNLKQIVHELKNKKTSDAETQSVVEVESKEVNTESELLWVPSPQQTPHASVHRTRKFSSSSDVAYRKDEIKRLRNTKQQLDDEIQTLQQQKLNLIKDMNELQNKAKEIEEPIIQFKWKGMRGGFTNNPGGNAKICRVSMSSLQELNGRYHQLDQRCKHLQQALRRQQQQSESLLHRKYYSIFYPPELEFIKKLRIG